MLETTSPGGLRTLWLGTWGGGIVRLAPNSWRSFDASSGMPTGAVTYATYASTVAAGADETTAFYATNVSPNLLVNGTNVLAVEVHQANATSTDLSLDLELSADPAPPRLSVTLSGNAVVLAWPMWATGFRLQSAARFAPVTTWSNLLASITATNGQNRVTVAASDAQQFFRLANP